MATHFSILAWNISWTEEAGGLQFMELQKSRTQLTYMCTYISVYICVSIYVITHTNTCILR